MMTLFVTAQSKEGNELSDFTIDVATSQDEVFLTCSKGCAWKTLTFNLFEYANPQAVNFFGMTQLNSEESDNDSEKDFLFTVRRVGDKIQLQGIRGLAWSSLSFIPEGTVNQFGVKSLGEK